MAEEINQEQEEVAAAEEVQAAAPAEELAEGEMPAEEGEEEDEGTIIRDTDIVFDCPHCGHNLAIDYRGAGLQIECTNCGESVLVPIPSGMKIDDLDLEPGEILKQLFATRRNLQKAEQRAAELEERLHETLVRDGMYRALCESLTMQLEELGHCVQAQQQAQQRSQELLERMRNDIEGSATTGEEGELEAGEAAEGEVEIAEAGEATDNA